MHSSLHNSTECIVTAQRILEQPKYLSNQANQSNDNVSLIPIEFFETLVRLFIKYIIEPILHLLNVATPDIDAQSPLFFFIASVTTAVVLFLAFAIGIKIIRHRKSQRQVLDESPTIRISAESIMKEAEKAAAINDFSFAMRLLASATIRLLRRHSSNPVLECMTFNEILHTYRQAPFAQQISVIFLAAELWYRNASISQDDYRTSKAAYHSLAAMISDISTSTIHAK